jgi:small subunit ribosomal protein S15
MSVRSKITKKRRLYKPQGLTRIEVENLILKLAKEGNSCSKIGTILRDQYGVGKIKAVIGRSISSLLEAKKLSPKLPEDLKSLIRKAVNVAKHLENNPKDFHNKRGLSLVEAKIRRLVKYYKRVQRLPKDWEYSLEATKVLVE